MLFSPFHREFLDSALHHPIRTFSEQLNVGIGDTFPLQRMDLLPSPLKANDFHAALSWGTNINESNLFWLSATKEEDIHVETVYCGTIAPLISCCPYILEVSDSGAQGDEQEHGSSVFCLRPSLTVFFVELCHRPDFIPEMVYALSGPVFRKCLISQWTMPVFHEAIYLCGFKKDAEGSSSQTFMDAITNSVESIFRTFLDETQINLDKDLSTPASSGKHFSLTYRLQLTKGDYSIHLQTPRLDCGGNHDTSVGTMVTLELGELCCDLDVSLVMLNLDTLVMLALGISDWRMLWTYDVRFINQFCSGKPKHFQSFSLFPPSYVHDVSFWVTNEELFDELEFHTLVRRVSNECVTDIKLLDSFRHSETGMLSLCYRLKYQSCDKALSEVQASTMQLQVRRELQTMLQVTLR